jgi:hypothetical protein
MMKKPNCPIIAIEEHYWDPELAKHFTGPEAGRGNETDERLYDLGSLRLKEMDEAGIDIQVLSHGAPSTQKLGADIAAELTRQGRLLDHLVGCGKQRLRNGQAKRLCGLEIDNQLILGRCLHRHVGWLLALEDAIDIPRGSPDRIVRIGPVRDQATVYGVITIRIN